MISGDSTKLLRNLYSKQTVNISLLSQSLGSSNIADRGRNSCQDYHEALTLQFYKFRLYCFSNSMIVGIIEIRLEYGTGFNNRSNYSLIA